MSDYKILLVEDSIQWGRIIKTHIEAALSHLEACGNIDIRQADNLDSAFRILIGEKDWNLLCTDIGLSEGSSDNDCVSLVSIAAARKIPTVIVSGIPTLAPQIVRDFFVDYKIVDFFPKKNFDAKTFVKIVKGIFDLPNNNRIEEENNLIDFDVFISHNSKDKQIVRELSKLLKCFGLRVWLDEEQLPAGRPWQREVETIIETTRFAIVLIGKDGIGPWEKPEIRACLSQFVDRGLPVVPVLLPGASSIPDLPLFLREFTYVDLRHSLDNINTI